MGDKQQIYYMNGKAKLLQANLFITEKKCFLYCNNRKFFHHFLESTGKKYNEKNSIYVFTISMRTQTLISKACNFRQRIA